MPVAYGRLASLTGGVMIAVALLSVAVLLAGISSVIAGIYLLAGLPWALIAGGLAAIILAFVIREGLRANG